MLEIVLEISFHFTSEVCCTATVISNSVLIISHITFRDCRVHIFFLTTFLVIAVCVLDQACSVRMTGYWPRFTFLWTNEKRQNEQCQYPSEGTREIHFARAGSQSERRNRFILPVRGFSIKMIIKKLLYTHLEQNISFHDLNSLVLC